MERIRKGFVLILCMLCSVPALAKTNQEFEVVGLDEMKGSIKIIASGDDGYYDYDDGNYDYYDYLIDSRKSMKKHKIKHVDTHIKVSGKVYRVKFRYIVEDGEVRIFESDQSLSGDMFLQIHPIKGNVNEVLVDSQTSEGSICLIFNLADYRYRDYLEGCNIENLLSGDCWFSLSPDCDNAILFSVNRDLIRPNWYAGEAEIKTYLLKIKDKECLSFDKLFPDFTLEFSHWLDESHMFLTKRNDDEREDGFVFDVVNQTLKQAYGGAYGVSSLGFHYDESGKLKMETNDVKRLFPFIIELYPDRSNHRRHCLYAEEAKEVYLMNKLTGGKTKIPSLQWNPGMEGYINEEGTKAILYNRSVMGNDDYMVYLTETYKWTAVKSSDDISVLDIANGKATHLSKEQFGYSRIDSINWKGNDLVIQYVTEDGDVKIGVVQFNEDGKKKKKVVDEKEEGALKTVDIETKDDKSTKADGEDTDSGSREEAMMQTEEAAKENVADQGGAAAFDEKEMENTESNTNKSRAVYWIIAAVLGIFITSGLLFGRKFLDNRKKSK